VESLQWVSECHVIKVRAVVSREKRVRTCYVSKRVTLFDCVRDIVNNQVAHMLN